MKIRKIKIEDLSKIENLANLIYPNDYYESPESFESKIKVSNGCFLAEEGDCTCGYVVSFPFYLNQIFNLNCFYTKVEKPTCHYIHDLCVHPEFRGFGIGKSLFEKVCEKATLPLCLVSVLKSEDFWSKLGFVIKQEITYHNLPAFYMFKESA